MSARPGLALLSALVIAGAACAPELKDPGFGPPEEIPSTGPVRAAFLAEVDVRDGQVRITAPQISLNGMLRMGPGDLAFSLVGGDAVTLVSSNFSASAVGAFSPGKVRVQFDLSVTNRLAQVELIGPTAFPQPPPGTTGPLVFPYDIAVATTSGGTSGSNNDIIVVLPSRGLVAPSFDWDGAPFNFFNDADCAAPSGVTDCFRWEEFPAPLVSGATTAGRRVGFDIDPTVGQFIARVLVAADIHDPTVPDPGAVQGQVTSTTLGPLAGVTVAITPAGQSAITSSTGTFQFANVPSGTSMLTISGLPSACTVPPPTPVLVPAGGVGTISIPVDCVAPPLLGEINGTVTNQLGTPLSAVSIQAVPSGLGPSGSTSTNAFGIFSLPSVPVSDGSGSLVLGTLSGTCADPGAIPYAGLTTATPLTITIVVNCP